MLQTLKQNWFSNLRGDLLAGLVVALALIPEAIAFSIIAGVDPKIGLYASFSMAVVIAFAGGRPGMISAATGAMALLMVNLVKDHGLQYLLAATLLCGVLQILAGYLRLGSLMRFVSRSVMTGFVNALAILIFMAQLPELTDVGWPVYAMTAAAWRSSTASRTCHGSAGYCPLRWYASWSSPAYPSTWAWTSAPSATWVSCPTACRCSSGRTCR